MIDPLVAFLLVAFGALAGYWVRGLGIMGAAPASSSPPTLRTLPTDQRRDMPEPVQSELDSIADGLRRELRRLVSIRERVSYDHASLGSGWIARESPLTASERILRTADDSIREAITEISSADLHLPVPRDRW